MRIVCLLILAAVAVLLLSAPAVSARRGGGSRRGLSVKRDVPSGVPQDQESSDIDGKLIIDVIAELMVRAITTKNKKNKDDANTTSSDRKGGFSMGQHRGGGSGRIGGGRIGGGGRIRIGGTGGKIGTGGRTGGRTGGGLTKPITGSTPILPPTFVKPTPAPAPAPVVKPAPAPIVKPVTGTGSSKAGSLSSAMKSVVGDNRVPKHSCAHAVRVAIEKATGKAMQRPNDGGHGYAKNFGPGLEKMGFQKVSGEPKVGDVVIMQATSKSVAGHMQMLTTTGWVSDFNQRGFYPGSTYAAEKPSYQIYRLP